MSQQHVENNKTHYSKIVFGLILGLSMILVACKDDTEQQLISTAQPSSNAEKLQQEFETWRQQQDQKQIDAYQQYLAKHLQQPPSLFALSYNIHIKKPECMQYRFGLAPESQWKNIVKPLQLIEKLKQQRIIENYRVTSIYRSVEANKCARGAKLSKHLQNYAVDFQILDAHGQAYPAGDTTIQKRLCDYWRIHGQRLNLGFGTYTQHRFHIDVQGFRTWGHTYKRDSSTCL